MTDSGSDYSVDWHEDLVVFTLNSPKRLNAVTRSMALGLRDCVDEIPRRKVRALIITGAGDKAFCSGTDLREAQELGDDAASAKADFIRDLLFRIHTMPITSVAAINGLALGGGFEIALACTFRVMSASAGVGLPEVKLAVIPAYGGTQYLPALVGFSRAADIMLTGRTVKAEEALAMGLVNRLADESQSVLDQAIAFAREVTVNSQFGINGIRQCLDGAALMATKEGLEHEKYVINNQGESPDPMEGIQAFLEKRPPKFRHY